MLSVYLLLLVACTATTLAHSHSHGSHGHHRHIPRRPAQPVHTLKRQSSEPVCLPIPSFYASYEDYRAKIRPEEGTCQSEEYIGAPPAADPPKEPGNSTFSAASLRAASSPDFTCDQHRPCYNGACCGIEGHCGFGEDYCGNGDSPNDACWSNCDAKAECGRNAKEPGQTCPLNVCCSQHGFCGMTDEFCAVTDDDLTSCQSNCEQPGSGSSGGNVQQRVIGYYEVWNHKKACIGMGMQDIPVGSLTHIYYSFGYIQPESYEIVPMDDHGGLSTDTFTEFASLKNNNPALKVIIALGGWTFNDNNTIWQPVFSDLSSTQEKRGRFIDELLTFLNRYGFDGVDVDWEYPGAGDRGGNPDDGVNFTKLLEEMRAAFDVSGRNLEISFTAPTSFWYMRHFDIEASVAACDFVNVMSYDLHGVWDAKNPIGPQVLAHTNLTEIKLALDLFWRNNVPAEKINLGLGFYGRSFQLTDPNCYQPGCVFKGGAAKGPCTNNSGTLSYFEIMDIIKEYDLTPYYDEVNAVKYITWGGDQWVSYDDFDTIQQKIEFSNALGLGGLLIWAIDLDTKQLDALEAVLYPEPLGVRAEESNAADNWQDAGEGHCRATECGVTSCNVGETKITETECADGREKFHALCCPLASAPNAEKCTWRGNPNDCNGQCHAGEVALQSSRYGAGGKCTDGRKFYCCPAEAKIPNCRWTDCNALCNSSENTMTFRYSECRRDEAQMFCCDKDEEWTDCNWRGEAGSCFDNHCQTGWEVALTTSWGGEHETCGFRLERERSFCCTPGGGSSPFLPVPLEYLFENPPSKEEANTKFDLKTDPTWGGKVDTPFTEDPDNAAFGFVVLTSPDELQVSLDKRDGSHWELFDCHDPNTEGEHTIRMMCTDQTTSSNCDKIHLGHGAVGTIVEMPKGCGPGKYAVVKEMTTSSNQTLPHHLTHRGLQNVDTIYDLTFDYKFSRVPRDLGNTQMRIDVSNEPEYWDAVVNKSADARKHRKRSLEDYEGNHRRWLEETWRDDHHFGGLSENELHKRWFGSDIIDWLSSIISGVEVTTSSELSHSYNEDFILKIIDQRMKCPHFAGKLDVHAETNVNVDVHYGFTLIATLGGENGVDLSKSYLYFRTKGGVQAKFVVDAAFTAMFDTGDVLMFSADKFGAAFAVPGIVTIGPNFKLFGRLEGEATLGVNFESQVKLLDWDIRQTYPATNDAYDPEAYEDPEKSGTQSVLQPTFEYGVSLTGHMTAHVKPTITFGIDFNQDFIPVDSCAVNLVADGHVTFHAELQGGQTNQFCYGLNAGADLYATIDAPPAFSWALPQSPFPIVPVDTIQIYPPQGRPSCYTLGKRDGISGNGNMSTASLLKEPHNDRLSKRANVYGPLVPRITGLKCPGSVDLDDIPSCPLCTGGNSKRDGESCAYDPDITEEVCTADSTSRSAKREIFNPIPDVDEDMNWQNITTHRWEKRRYHRKYLKWNGNNILVGPYQSACDATNIVGYFGFRDLDSTQACDLLITKLEAGETTTGNSLYATEHVYEPQFLSLFLNWISNTGSAYQPAWPTGYTRPSNAWFADYFVLGKTPGRTFQHDSWQEAYAGRQLAIQIGGNHDKGRLTLADAKMNRAKGSYFAFANPGPDVEETNVETRIKHRSQAGVFSYLAVDHIWDIFQETSWSIESTLMDFDLDYPWGQDRGELGRPDQSLNGPVRGFRDLYCYWIDASLAHIETMAERWHVASLAAYQADAQGSEPEGQAWIRSVLTNGDLAVGNLKFRRSANRHPEAGERKIWTASNYEGLWLPSDGFGAAGPF